MLVKNIRKELQKKLGSEPYHFVIAVTDDTIEIEESNNRGSAGTLQKVIICDIPYDDDRYKFWRINLENEVQGLSSSNRTGDTALAVVRLGKKTYLDVYLIELKSQIKDKRHDLRNTVKKFSDSISRFYFLLSLNDNNAHKAFPNLEIRFVGLVFYNGKAQLEPNYPAKNDEIHQIFKNEKQQGMLFCETILDRQKIPVKFFKNFDDSSGSIELSFMDMERKITQIRRTKS
jgi:hypothetical protein